MASSPFPKRKHLLNDEDRTRCVGDDVARGGSASKARNSLLSSLADDDEVDFVVGCNADNGLTGITVGDVECRLVSGLTKLVSVGGELVHSLFSECLEHLILALGVDGKGARDPGPGEDVGGKDRGNCDADTKIEFE